MRPVIIALIAAIGVAGLCFLLAGFVAWNWNPEGWDIAGRMFFVLLTVSASGSAAIITYASTDHG